jgi:hypothetical protein
MHAHMERRACMCICTSLLNPKPSLHCPLITPPPNLPSLPSFIPCSTPPAHPTPSFSVGVPRIMPWKPSVSLSWMTPMYGFIHTHSHTHTHTFSFSFFLSLSLSLSLSRTHTHTHHSRRLTSVIPHTIENCDVANVLARVRAHTHTHTHIHNATQGTIQSSNSSSSAPPSKYRLIVCQPR